MKRDFILEIGTEELPASFVRIGMKGLYDGFKSLLEREKIDYDEIFTYATPRRLALYIKDLDEVQASKEKKIKGPPYKISFDKDGNPLPPAIGFVKKQGVRVEDLVIGEEGKARYIYAIKKEEGRKTEEILREAIPELIKKLYFPKTMLWGRGDFKFARPIHWIVSLFGNDVIPFEIAGIKSSNYTFGHRFIAPFKKEIEEPIGYIDLLKQLYVIVDRNERKTTIENDYKEVVYKLDGDTEIPSYGLLEEVTDLVEYPTVMVGKFSEKYLELPDDIPVSVMEDHQRYFPVYKDKKLLPYFVFVSNSISENKEIIVKGNERVLKARLEDAFFYFTKDKEVPLEKRVEELKKVVFHKELGTLYDKVERIRDISREILSYIEKEELLDTVDKVAYLCKADLVTYIVREFPELEGIMGKEYALIQGFPEEVAEGIYEHYLPKKAQDPIPKTWGGKIVSLADKLDTIFSYFSIDLVPSGSFDPYGLRRKAQGVISILLKDRDIDIPLCDILQLVYKVMSKSGFVKIEHLTMARDFFADRVKNLLTMEGIKYDIINAVIDKRIIDSIKAIFKKAKVFNDLYAADAFKNVVLIYNRLNNILKKFEVKEAPNPELFNTEFEVKLFREWNDKRVILEEYVNNKEYKKAIDLISNIKHMIDEFFDNVLVMDKDERIKENRLRLLNYLREDINKLGDFSKIEGVS